MIYMRTAQDALLFIFIFFEKMILVIVTKTTKDLNIKKKKTKYVSDIYKEHRKTSSKTIKLDLSGEIYHIYVWGN